MFPPPYPSAYPLATPYVNPWTRPQPLPQLPVAAHYIPPNGPSSHQDQNFVSPPNTSHQSPPPPPPDAPEWYIPKANCLPSSDIITDNLVDPQEIVARYSKLKTECKVSTLAVTSAKESYFDNAMLAKCTVVGCRDLPGLPKVEVQNLKQFLFSLFPKHWKNPAGFETLWAGCVTSINQCCKAIRKGRI